MATGTTPAAQTSRSQISRTQTSRFGVGRRENHDASSFYARFRGLTSRETMRSAAPSRSMSL